MSRPHEQLACAIARHSFGPIVGEVVRLLLTHPNTSVPLLLPLCTPFFTKHFSTQSTDPNYTHSVQPRQHLRLIRNSLAVLMQHEIVHAISGPTSSAPVHYCIRVRKLLLRARFPLYLGFARQRFGTVGELAMRVLLQRGLLTSRMMFMATLDDALPKMSLSVPQAEACLADMARSGFLRWKSRRTTVALGAHQRSDANVDETSERVKRPRPADPYTLHDNIDSDVEDGNADSTDDESSDEDDPPDKVMEEIAEEGMLFIGCGDARRKVGAPTRENDVDVWAACFWRLNREFRNSCCVKVMCSRLRDNDAARIFTFGLQLALDREDAECPAEDLETSDIAIDDIENLLQEKGIEIASSSLWDAIRKLLAQSPQFVLPIPESAPSKLRFVPGQLIADARRKTLLEVVTSRYGRVGRRVFEALAIEGGMEESMVADKCMVHVKVVRSMLYKMYEDKMVCLQEVPRSHDQQRSSNWYYLWNVNLLSAFRSLLDVMYKASLNLFLRLEALQKEASKKDNEADAKRMRAQENVLMGSILRLDQSIMVMRDFGMTTSKYLPVHYQIVDGPVGRVVKKRR